MAPCGPSRSYAYALDTMKYGMEPLCEKVRPSAAEKYPGGVPHRWGLGAATLPYRPIYPILPCNQRSMPSALTFIIRRFKWYQLRLPFLIPISGS